MTAHTLIGAIQALRPDFKVVGEPLVRLCDVLSIIRQHDAGQPPVQFLDISPECVQKSEKIGHVEQLQDVVERVAKALCKSDGHEHPDYTRADLQKKGLCLWHEYIPIAKIAIAAMPLRSVGLSDAKGREEAERPAKELRVKVPGAASETLNQERDRLISFARENHDWSQDWQKGVEDAFIIVGDFLKRSEMLVVDSSQGWAGQIIDCFRDPENGVSMQSLIGVIRRIQDRAIERESIHREVDRGLPMSAIRSGMRLKGTTMADNFPVCTVTELTETGFKYIHDRWYWRADQWSEGGECFGQGGYSYYKEVGQP